MSIRSCPKPAPKPKKRRKPIAARSGRIRRKCVALRYRPPTPEQIAFAEKCRRENIMQTSGAQPTLALCVALDALGIRYWREEPTWFDGSQFVLWDFWLPDLKITIEVDGAQHRLEHVRDAEKAKIILDSRGFRTIRWWNGEVLRPGFQDRLRRALA